MIAGFFTKLLQEEVTFRVFRNLILVINGDEFDLHKEKY